MGQGQCERRYGSPRTPDTYEDPRCQETNISYERICAFSHHARQHRRQGDRARREDAIRAEGERSVWPD
jgi:hypothetical protein